VAQERAKTHGGTLILRDEDLDSDRARRNFAESMVEDLRWFGFRWQEGPDCGGEFGPYRQSERREFYTAAFRKLQQGGFVYPCTCSRKDVLRALQAPHQGEEEPVYPGTCRQRRDVERVASGATIPSPAIRHSPPNWRFHVPDGERISFHDEGFGLQNFIAGKHFGDFVVWRHDGLPSYQLAVVVDDATMRITEVVRGADLLLSTARQLLLYRALGLTPPAFFHCPLMTDETGVRLAKRHDALSLRRLREQGVSPESLRQNW
jgi:glutamyl-tRNA synthetase